MLIDEGHRGAGGDEWKKRRDMLSEDGFAFEYSATFGQSISAATGTKKENLLNEYSKAILFDYSYKFFKSHTLFLGYRSILLDLILLFYFYTHLCKTSPQAIELPQTYLLKGYAKIMT